MNPSYEAIQLLAKAFGIELNYTDNWGQTFQTHPSVIRGILETKGVVIDPAMLTTSPQTVAFCIESTPTHIHIYIDLRPDFLEKLSVNGVITLTEANAKIATQSFHIRDQGIGVHLDERTGLTELSIPVPGAITPGDYSFVVHVAADGSAINTELRLIVGPGKAYTPAPLQNGQRVAGIAISLYGVRSDSNWGCGDFSDLLKIIDWAHDDLGAHFVGLNPLHALFNTRPYNCSPYMPSSRIFYNYIYIDVLKAGRSIGDDLSDRISADPGILAEAKRLRDVEYVDYEGVAALKLRVLHELYDSFYENKNTLENRLLWKQFENYVGLKGEDLEKFATFCVLRENLLSNAPNLHNWSGWPEGFRHPDSDETLRFKAKHGKEILFHCFLQWISENQLGEAQRYAIEKGMIIGLYNDIALAVDPNGADNWSQSEYFVRGFSVGAPPDALGPDGQDWGFQPPNCEQVKKSGFSLFRKSLEANSKHGGALRIDHVMQIHHLFWIPRGDKALNGIYVKDYEEDLLNVLTLESVTNKTMIVGEDLGTLPFNFRERLIDRGIFSYRIFYFERDRLHNQIPFYDYPSRAIVSLSTHDLPTFSGFWQGLDIDLRMAIRAMKPEEEAAIRSERIEQKAKIIERLVRDNVLPAEVAHHAWESEIPTDELHTAVLSFILKTPCQLAIISLEDLMLDTRQQNLPGTTFEHPNWVTKTKFGVEELKSHPEAIRMALKFNKLLVESGRYFEFRA
ncbi:MAG: 4-alpha-glucanotransferase [Deltaproteobacteria bacterium]|nr:4-alpha-glucanotransferase [Deltaproteobacteria bacterium]